jgi:hypothetical protein
MQDASGAGLPTGPLCPPRKKDVVDNAGSLLSYCGLRQVDLLSPLGYQRWPQNPAYTRKAHKRPRRTSLHMF